MPIPTKIINTGITIIPSDNTIIISPYSSLFMIMHNLMLSFVHDSVSKRGNYIYKKNFTNNMLFTNDD